MRSPDFTDTPSASGSRRNRSTSCFATPAVASGTSVSFSSAMSFHTLRRTSPPARRHAVGLQRKTFEIGISIKRARAGLSQVHHMFAVVTPSPSTITVPSKVNSVTVDGNLLQRSPHPTAPPHPSPARPSPLALNSGDRFNGIAVSRVDSQYVACFRLLTRYFTSPHVSASLRLHGAQFHVPYVRLPPRCHTRTTRSFRSSDQGRRTGFPRRVLGIGESFPSTHRGAPLSPLPVLLQPTRHLAYTGSPVRSRSRTPSIGSEFPAFLRPAPSAPRRQ